MGFVKCSHRMSNLSVSACGQPVPPDEPGTLSTERLNLVLDEATALVFKQGYGATHMSAIAARCGMSKKTLYKAFASKEDLLTAVVDARLARLSGDLEADQGGHTPEEQLSAHLQAICGFALSPTAVGLYRLVLTEGSRFPELTRAYLDQGVLHGRDMLARWIEQQTLQGVVQVADPQLLAGMLLNMVIAEPLRELVLGQTPSISDTVLAKRIRCAVELFFHGASGR